MANFIVLLLVETAPTVCIRRAVNTTRHFEELNGSPLDHANTMRRFGTAPQDARVLLVGLIAG